MLVRRCRCAGQAVPVAVDDREAGSIVTDESPPARLYKYRGLGGPDYKILSDILVNNTLWWSSPIAFNDPFDCLPSIDTGGNLPEKFAWGERSARRHGMGKNRHERRAIVSDIARRKLRRGLGASLANAGGIQAWRDMLVKMGVLCLTSCRDHMLMWGHYADSHRGLCLEFDTAKAPFNLAHRVTYDDERPVFRPLQIDRSGLMERILLRKAAVWSYEDEWRIFGPGTPGRHAFPSDALTGVILGALMPVQEEREVRAMLEKRSTPVEVRRARLDERLYRLSIDAAAN